MTTSRTLGDGGRVRKARSVRRVAPVVAELAGALAAVPELTSSSSPNASAPPTASRRTAS
jgi:hypothetical protein